MAMAWLLAGLSLLLAGRFTPVLMLAVWVPLATVLACLGLRWLPGWWPGARPAPEPRQARTPWWAVAGVVAVAAAFGVYQLIYHSQQIIVLRDPASYIQFAAWIAQHGSLPIPQARCTQPRRRRWPAGPRPWWRPSGAARCHRCRKQGHA
jgi:hypothetical protein